MKLVKVSLLTCLLVALVVGVAFAQVQELDFSKWVGSGGTWSVEGKGKDAVITQSQPSGGHASFVSTGLTLPKNFSFEAELGCISGNQTQGRPYFGIFINHEGNNNYGWLYRKTADQFEFVKHTFEHNPRTFLGTTPKPEAWQWNLAEWHTLKIVKKDNVIEAYVDGQLLHTFNDSSFSGGQIGLYTYSTAAVFRNIKLEYLN